MYKLDETDYKILEILKKDGRCSYSEIADEVHLSRVAVRDRIIKMQENEFIRGYTVLINSMAINKGASVFMEIDTDPYQIEFVGKALSQLEDVAIVAQYSGGTALHVHIYIRDITDLAGYLSRNIYSIQGIKQVHTQVLIKNYKTTAYLTT